ncbi:MAG: class I SAM-dependent methyltransferase [Bacteroidota bacterium]|nr:class I SAM-dependent methyltransferase [Bacteroidota bacterium]
MENLNACPVCNAANFVKIFDCKDYVATGETFAIVECPECSLRYTNPRPAESEIAKYYQSDKYISHSGSGKSELGVTYKLYDWVRNFSIGTKLNLIKKYHKSGKLLDLGCGLGYFLNGVKLDQTFEATGADVSDEALAFIKKEFGIEAMNETDLSNISNQTFNIITQWHVMEHVHRLDERMLELKRLLSKNGTMFIAVPISNSFDAKHYKQFWDAYDVPRHLYHFTPKSFRMLMEKNDFKVIKQKAMLFDSPYISMRSEYHQNHSFGFVMGAIWGIVSILSAWFTGNYSSILFVVKHK